MPKFNNVELSEATILATRQHFANIHQGCIDEVLAGYVVLASHNKKECYIGWRQSMLEDNLTGRTDHGFTFLQRAYWIQTGEMLALLP